MDPSGLAFGLITTSIFFTDRVCEPRNFRRKPRPTLKGFQDAVPQVLGATNAIEEFRLQHPRYAQGRRRECYAKGGVGADEQIVAVDPRQPPRMPERFLRPHLRH